MQKKRILRSAALGGALALTAGLIAPAAANAVGDAFDPNNAAVFIGWSATTTQLSQAVLSGDGSEFQLQPVGSANGIEYNALGFNTVNNYLYAMRSGAQQPTLVKIGSDGIPEVVGTVAGLPSGVDFNQGTFGLGDDEGKFYVRAQGSTTQLWEIDVETQEGTIIELQSGVPNVSDIVYRDGLIWAYNGVSGGGFDNLFWRIDPATGAVASFSAAGTGINSSQAYGGQWLYGNGNLGITGNDTGQVYQIAIEGADTDAPTFTVVSQAKGQPTDRNDAASIFGLPADLEIAKTGDDVFVPGEPYTYTITVTNNGEGDSTGSIVTDVLPSGLENPEAEAADCSIADGVMTCNVGPIIVGGSLDFTVTGTAADDATDESMVNAVSVVGNEEDPTPDNNSAEFGPVAAAPSLTIEKTASPTPITPNTKTVDYTFVVTNTGNVPLSDVTVTDPGPVGGKGTMSEIICEADALEIDGSFECVATYTLSPEDHTGEPLKNEATATAKDPSGAEIGAAAPALASVPTVLPEPKLDLVKTAVGGPAKTAGQKITYNFEVTNTGNVDVENIEVAEGTFTGKGELSAIECPAEEAALLAIDESVTCTATYTVVEADLTGKDIENTATASGETPFGPVESNVAKVELTTVAPAAPGAKGVLASTGGQPMVLAGGIALLLLAAGATTVVVARRKMMS